MRRNIMGIRTFAVWTVVMACIWNSESAAASSLSIDPTRVTLSGLESRSITLRNRNPYPVLLQARILSWGQSEDGQDQLLDSDDLLMSPPIVELEPDSEQIVRVAFRGAALASSELTYRIIFSEVARSAAGDSDAPGVQFLIEFSIPVFVRPDREVKPAIQWDLNARGPESWSLTASNVGSAHIQIRSLLVLCGQAEVDQPVASVHQPAYILPGSRRAWHLSVPAEPCGLNLTGIPSATTVSETTGEETSTDPPHDLFSDELNVSASAADNTTKPFVVSANTDAGLLEAGLDLSFLPNPKAYGTNRSQAQP